MASEREAGILELVPIGGTETGIVLVRGKRVIVDADLAAVYGVTIKLLNEQVERNAERFPPGFAFRMTWEEHAALSSQNSTLVGGRGAHRKCRPCVFTERGALMAANVLNSERAMRMSVYVVRAFVELRREMMSRVEKEKRMARIEAILVEDDSALRDLYERMRPLLLPPPQPPRPRIGIHGIGR